MAVAAPFEYPGDSKTCLQRNPTRSDHFFRLTHVDLLESVLDSTVPHVLTIQTIKQDTTMIILTFVSSLFCIPFKRSTHYSDSPVYFIYLLFLFVTGLFFSDEFQKKIK
jgi:hypothetical protein